MPRPGKKIERKLAERVRSWIEAVKSAKRRNIWNEGMYTRPGSRKKTG